MSRAVFIYFLVSLIYWKIVFYLLNRSIGRFDARRDKLHVQTCFSINSISRACTFVTCEIPSILFDYEDDQRDSPPAREVRRSGRVPLKVANGIYCNNLNSRRSARGCENRQSSRVHRRYLFLYSLFPTAKRDIREFGELLRQQSEQ